jgi:hypothetical protein
MRPHVRTRTRVYTYTRTRSKGISATQVFTSHRSVLPPHYVCIKELYRDASISLYWLKLPCSFPTSSPSSPPLAPLRHPSATLPRHPSAPRPFEKKNSCNIYREEKRCRAVSERQCLFVSTQLVEAKAAIKSMESVIKGNSRQDNKLKSCKSDQGTKLLESSKERRRKMKKIFEVRCVLNI